MNRCRLIVNCLHTLQRLNVRAYNVDIQAKGRFDILTFDVFFLHADYILKCLSAAARVGAAKHKLCYKRLLTGSELIQLAAKETVMQIARKYNVTKKISQKDAFMS